MLVCIQSFIAVLLAVAVNVKGQSQTCTNGFRCIHSQQFDACGAEAEDYGRGPFSCPRGGNPTICVGSDIGFGATREEAGPCLRRPDCTAEGSFPFKLGNMNLPELCPAYYTCKRASGQWQVETQVCTPGFEFSTTTSKCEPADQAGCSRAAPIPSVTTTGAPEGSSGPVAPGPTTRAPSQTTPPPIGITDYPEYPDPEGPFVCPKNGRHADPQSCKHYYLCSSFGQRHLRCPLRTNFNEQTKRCWFRVDCGSRGP